MLFRNKYIFILAVLALLIGAGIMLAQGQLGGGWLQTSSLQKGLVGHWKLDATGKTKGTNKITNWDVESGIPQMTSYGTARGSVEQSTEQVYQGIYSGKYTGDGVTVGMNHFDVLDSPVTNLEVGKTYYAEVMVYLPSGQSATGLSFHDSWGSSTTIDSTTTTDQWVKLNGIFSVEADSGNKHNYLYLQGTDSTANTDYFYFDNWIIQEIDMAADSTGHTNHGSIQGNPTYTTDHKGTSNSAMSFSGGDYINAGSDDSLDSATLTISAWIKRSNPSNNRDVIVGTTNTNGYDRNHYLDFEIYSDNKLLLLFGDGTIHGDVYSTGTITDSNWHHVVVTRNDATEKVQFFIDGVAEAEKSYANSLGTIIPLGTDDLLIAKTGFGGPFDGSLDDVRLYNRVLSATEIQRLYETYQPEIRTSQHKGLVGHWPLTSESVTSSEELLTNGDFSSGDFTGWGGANLETKEIVSWQGVPNVVHFQEDSDTWNGIPTTGTNLVAGKKYIRTVSLWVPTGGTLADIRIGSYDNWSNVVYGFQTPTKTGEWETLSYEVIASSTGSASGAINIQTRNSQDVYIAFGSLKEIDTKASDLTPNANHGAITGTSVRNHGYEFDGTDDYIEIGDKSELDFNTGSFSVTAWIKDSGSGGHWFVKRESGSTNAGYELGIDGTNGSLSWYLNDGTSAIADTADTTSASDGTWHHVGIVFDRTNNQIRRYVDGTATGTVSNFGSLGSIDNAFRASIGARLGSSPDNEFTGSIANLRIYDRALAASEVSDLYNGADIPSPIAHWPLDNGAGDTSGNGNHGTVNGATLIGEAASFDGVDAQATINNDTMFQLDPTSDSFTLSSWINIDAASTSNAFILGKNSAYGLSVGTNLKPRMYFGASSSDVVANTTIDTNTWYHVTGVFNVSEAKIYVNGVLDNSGSISGSPSQSNNVTIGGITYPNYYFNGQIRDARIYNRALSAAEISQLYNQRRSPAVLKTGSLNKGLIGHWDMKSKDLKTGENLLINPSFETEDLTNWTANANYSASNDQSRYGNYSIKGIHDGSIEKPLAYQYATVEVGKDYVVSGWIKSDLTAGTHYLTTEGAAGGIVGETISGTTDWTFVQKTITATTTDLRVNVYPHSYPNGTTWSDFLSVKEINITADSTPNTNHGAIYGATAGDSATTFDGSSDYVDLGDISSTENTQQLTVSAWLKSDPSSAYRTAVSKGYYTGGSWELRMTRDSEGPIMRFGITTENGRVESLANFENSTWHHVVGVYDGAQTAIYYDGDLQDTGPQTGTIVDTSTTVKIGQNGSTSIPYEYWDGDMTGVRIYNRALSPREVKMLYDQGR
ncbi:carbohydrate binding domain-containing protein [Candidatus Gracilibacteria bacterium]|nr:carbohydrate binding domain-containing protein [Candidatus Gracilibacteria bacterium]MCF7819471.1 carbohydrate binding domain-containing protein [Candidatus Gracilibacteria bacterium]